VEEEGNTTLLSNLSIIQDGGGHELCYLQVVKKLQEISGEGRDKVPTNEGLKYVIVES